MRAIFLLALACTLILGAPLATARHYGPCTHEYFDALSHGNPKYAILTVQACVKRDVCELLCDVLP